MTPDHCLCGCTERLDAFGQLDLCDRYLEYLDDLDALDDLEDACWEGLRAA